MKLLLTGLLLSFNLHFIVGQDAIFYTESDTIEAEIKATSSSYFLTTAGNIKYGDIKKVSFTEAPNDALEEKLTSNDISYFIGNKKIPKSTTGANFGFHYEDQKLFYERIYFNEHSMLVNINGLTTKLKSLPGFSYETVGEQILIGSFEDLSVPSVTSGMNTPFLISQGKHKGSFKLQVKDKKYKLEIFNLETWMNIGIDVGMLQDNGRAYIWSTDFVNKKGQIRSGYNVVLQSFDSYFKELFSSIENQELDDF